MKNNDCTTYNTNECPICEHNMYCHTVEVHKLKHRLTENDINDIITLKTKLDNLDIDLDDVKNASACLNDIIKLYKE
jgi:uncharacterized protein YpuA (DUF1002 family)